MIVILIWDNYNGLICKPIKFDFYINVNCHMTETGHYISFSKMEVKYVIRKLSKDLSIVPVLCQLVSNKHPFFDWKVSFLWSGKEEKINEFLKDFGYEVLATDLYFARMDLRILYKCGTKWFKMNWRMPKKKRLTVLLKTKNVE